MSSMLRAASQIPVRSKFLIAVAGSESGSTVGEASAFTLDASWPAEIGSIATLADINANGVASRETYSSGDLFRDLGRQIMIVDEAGVHQALYREAMPQTNADAEGIATIGGSVWLRVWAADGSSVNVARLG